MEKGNKVVGSQGLRRGQEEARVPQETPRGSTHSSQLVYPHIHLMLLFFQSSRVVGNPLPFFLSLDSNSSERSSNLSTVFNLQAAHRELVLCILPLILSKIVEKIDYRKTNPFSRVHTNTAQQYTLESTGGPWKPPLLY